MRLRTMRNCSCSTRGHLTDSTSLLSCGVHVPGSFIQNGTLSEYPYQKVNTIRSSCRISAIPLLTLASFVFLKNARSCCYRFIWCDLVTELTKCSWARLYWSPVPYPSETMSYPFSIFLFTQKRDRCFPRISGIVSVSFTVFRRLLSQPRKCTAAGFLSALWLLYSRASGSLSLPFPAPSVAKQCQCHAIGSLLASSGAFKRRARIANR